ncbi:MAG TPA: MerR family transcriptional regulator [bacterium]|nr:MerR family transcriptional regulator [bacterium]
MVIPNKLYFRIGEVSRLTRTKPYVLRFWETEFPSLKPAKSKSGHRLYHRQDVETVLEIKQLLYKKGFTIPGARKHLAHTSKTEAAQRHLFLATLDSTELLAIRRELQSILTILSPKC